jgi:4-amino-4-deoxy-L-arabinose transferase-like glycosyltransferase
VKNDIIGAAGVAQPRIVARARAALRADGANIATLLIVKALVLLIGAWAYQTMTDRPLATIYDALAIWNRWDAPHYLDLAEYGYQNRGEQRLFLVFYPLFPWLTRVFGLLVGDYLIGAFVVSTLASIAVVLLLHRLATIDYGPVIARRAVWFLLIFPTSYFLHIGYTESLFIALVLGCFWAARTERWIVAGVLGALACLTRVNGLLLIPALLAEAAWQYRATRRPNIQWLAIGLVGLGLAGYLLLNQRVTGDPFAFLTIQREHWYKSLAAPWFGVGGVLRSITGRTPADAHMLGVQELIFIVLAGVATILSALRLRPAYTVWIGGNLLLLTSTSFIMSTPRYVLPLFPIMIVFACAVENQRWAQAITVWSLLSMGLFISLFVQGRWAF